MLLWITIIFACQLIGELVVAAASLPLPGPVVGMVLLFAFLVLKGSVPEPLEQIGGVLLNNLSLLFVPAGTGIITNLALLKANLAPIGLALLAGTCVTIAVTGWMMQRLSRNPPRNRTADPS